MSREIKFRAWDSVEKKMFVPDAIMNDGRAIVITFAYDKEKFPIMQYTGHRDVHNKEIYEGDIIRETEREKELRYVVLFGEWQYEHSGKYYDIVNGWHCRLWRVDEDKRYNEGFLLNGLCEKSIEVIGNIYEDSGLLK